MTKNVIEQSLDHQYTLPMLTLAIGDLFIPERAIDIPQKFKKLLAPNPQSIPTNNKINRVVCLGNILNSTSTLQFLNNISPKFELVKGEYDDANIILHQLQLIVDSQSKSPSRGANFAVKVPVHSRFVHDNLKIGFTSGSQIVPRGDPLALSALARELDVDVLIWGGTHRVEVYTLDGKFFVNPGSATGAFSFDWPEFEEQEEEEEEEEDEEKVPEENVENATKDNEESKSEHEVETTTTNETNETKEPTNSKEEDREEPESSNEPKESKEAGDTDTEAFKKTLYEVTELNTNIPSFCILDTKGSTCILYIYTYSNNEVKVDKVTYNKE